MLSNLTNTYLLQRVFLGKNRLIETTKNLMNDKRLSQYVNEHTMGALDNYAMHEKMKIYIKPLECDLFHSLAVKVVSCSKNNPTSFSFPVKLENGKEGVSKFLKELYTTIHKRTHAPETQSAPVSVKKHTAIEDFIDYVTLVNERINEAKLNKIRAFVDKNSGKRSLKGYLADTFEEMYGSSL